MKLYRSAWAIYCPTEKFFHVHLIFLHLNSSTKLRREWENTVLMFKRLSIGVKFAESVSTCFTYFAISNGHITEHSPVIQNNEICIVNIINL